jgi:hypothetical protein
MSLQTIISKASEKKREKTHKREKMQEKGEEKGKGEKLARFAENREKRPKMKYR